MAVITVPAEIGFENCQLTLMRATQEGRSPFTGKRQVVLSAYALWMFEGTVVPVQGIEAGRVRSFLTKLRGRANTFRLKIPAAEMPLSNYAGPQGLVKGAANLGTSLPTDGWDPNTIIVRDGDYFNVGDETKMASADIMSDANGNALLFFEPTLRVAPADNLQINVRDPWLYLSAQDDDIAKWGLKDYNTHNMKVTAIEAFE